MWLSSSDAEGAVPAVAREVSDVTGAGDTVVAILALALAAGATLAEAAALANHRRKHRRRQIRSGHRLARRAARPICNLQLTREVTGDARLFVNCQS